MKDIVKSENDLKSLYLQVDFQHPIKSLDDFLYRIDWSFHSYCRRIFITYQVYLVPQDNNPPVFF